MTEHAPDQLSVLYVCYLSLDDPLTHTQVVAYLAGLAEKGNTIHLLTYEHGRLTRTRRRELRRQLAARGIHWHGLRYHKRPSLPATIYDVLAGALVSAVIVRRHRLEALHARSHVPVAMALILKRFLRIPFIFDIRGLMAEEYVDAGRWAAGGVPFRITKRVEARAIEQSAAVVVLTRKVRDLLFGGPAARVHVIPCCTDVEEIASLGSQRDRVRLQLGLAGKVVLIYVGKFTGWYLEREMVEFFATARQEEPRFHFHVLTQSEPSPIFAEFARSGVPRDAFSIAEVPPHQVGKHLAAADASISFIRPCVSKMSSSPTKIGEYLAAGLPIVSTAGIGDVDELLADAKVGVLVRDLDAPGYRAAARELAELIQDESAHERGQAAAEAELSLTAIGIPRYETLYRDVARFIAGRVT